MFGDAPAETGLFCSDGVIPVDFVQRIGFRLERIESHLCNDPFVSEIRQQTWSVKRRDFA